MRKFPLRWLICVCAFATFACQDARPPIVRAAALGQTEKVRSLLGGGDVNQPYLTEKRTLLHFACKRGAPDLVSFLLEKGADPKLKDSRGFTPADLALDMDQGGPRATSDQAACLVRLIKAGQVPSYPPDADGRTFLHVMAEKVDSSALIEALVHEGHFDVDARDANGWTPLHVAANNGRYDNCLALLGAGADVNAESTRQVGHSHRTAHDTVWDWRYEAGSRPMDVYRQFSGRGKSLVSLLQEHGGSANPNINNIRRP